MGKEEEEEEEIFLASKARKVENIARDSSFAPSPLNFFFGGGSPLFLHAKIRLSGYPPPPQQNLRVLSNYYDFVKKSNVLLRKAKHSQKHS